MLNRRVDGLSEKIDIPEESERIARFDISCFTQEERLLFDKIRDLQEQYGNQVPSEVLEANKALIYKAEEILAVYAVDTFKFMLLGIWGGNDEIERWYINLHFQNFLLDLVECLRHVQQWPQKERDDYLAFLKETGMIDKAFRCPRGPSSMENKKANKKRV